MRKVGVIGDGNVGATVAHNLVMNGYVDDLVLIDHNEQKVKADTQDYREAMPNAKYHVNIIPNDYSALKDADVIVSAVGHIDLQLKSGGNRFIELAPNIKEVKEIAPKIKASGFNGVLVAITNPVDVITSLYQELTGLPKNQVIGTGTLLDSARMKRAVGEAFNVDSRSVQGYNLGEHGNSQFTAWSTVRVLNQQITKVAEKKDLDLNQLDHNAKVGGYVVFRGKHYTNYGVATAAVRLVNTILNDAYTELVVSNYRKKYDTYLSYPVVVGRSGVVGEVDLDLTNEEKSKLQYSADFIKKSTRECVDKKIT